MRPRIRHAFYTTAAIGLISIGWYAHQVSLYVQDVHAKAAMCDKLDCYAMDEAAKVMLANGLPVLK